MTSKHYNSLQLVIKRALKKRGQFFFRKLPYTFTTKKPLEVRMGKGKGNHDNWVCVLKPGQILLEFNFLKKLNMFLIMNIIRKCMKRLPVKTCLIHSNFGRLPKNLDKNFVFITNYH